MANKWVKHTWINYDVLKEKFFKAEDITLTAFLKNEKIKSISKQNTSWWVKEKKQYLKEILLKARENTDKEVTDNLNIAVNKLLEWKVKILNTLLKRVDNLTDIVDKKWYNWMTTQELISINSLIKTELGEASEIKKIEWWAWTWFSIMIISNEQENEKNKWKWDK